MRVIAHLSDLHFGREDARVAEALLQDLREIGPSLVAISGDLTQRAGKKEFRAARAFLAQAPAPLIAVPGNHDIPLGNLFLRFFSPFRSYKKYICDDPDPTFIDSELALFGLNTAHPGRWKRGALPRERIEALEARLAAAPARSYRILLCHHPLLLPPGFGAPPVANSERILPLLERSGVDLILAGHLHRKFHLETAGGSFQIARSILLVQAGTAVSTRARGEPNAYNLLTLKEGEVAVAPRVWNGRRFGSPAVTIYRKAGERWVCAEGPLSPDFKLEN